MENTPKFIVVIRCANAPKSGGGRFRNPVHVRVMDSTQSEWHAVRGLNTGLIQEWTNVDGRYSGPKSAFGQARAAAELLACELNQQADICRV